MSRLTRAEVEQVRELLRRQAAADVRPTLIAMARRARQAPAPYGYAAPPIAEATGDKAGRNFLKSEAAS